MTSREKVAFVIISAMLIPVAFFAAGSDARADQTTFLPDFDGDGTVDFSDFSQFAAKFGQSKGDDGYEARFDLNGDGEIGFSDFVSFSQNFGKDFSYGMLLPWDLSRIVPIETIRTTPAGTRVFMRTEFDKGRLVDLEMTFIQVVDDFLPPMPVYMVEASDSVLVALGGIAKGMSGSPVFSPQGAWGAIAFGFDAQDSPPYYFFATPMEWVIGERGTVPPAKRAATWGENSIVPLDIPLLSTGLSRTQLHPEGSTSPLGSAIAAGLTAQRQTSFAPGRPLAVGLLLGELTLGAIGTVSFVDGNRIYGYGHSLDDAGPVSLPIIEAVVLGEISSLSAPFKFATLNPTVRGTLTEDRIPAVRGVLGEGPELVPIRSVYSFPSGAEEELQHTMPTIGVTPDVSANLVVRGCFGPLLGRVENDPDHSIRVTANVSFDVTDSTLARSRLYASPEGLLLSLIRRATSDLSVSLSRLMERDDYALQVTEANVAVELMAEPRYARIVDVNADTVASPGDTLDVIASLRVGRRIDRDIDLRLGVPESFPPGVYSLVLGSAAEFAAGGGFGRFPVQQTLEEVFNDVNSEDDNVVLEALLTFDMPFGPPAGPGVPPGPGRGPRPSTSVRKDVDLVLRGLESLSIKIVVPTE